MNVFIKDGTHISLHVLSMITHINHVEFNCIARKSIMDRVCDKFLQYKYNHFLGKLNESLAQVLIELDALKDIMNVKIAYEMLP